MDYWNSRPSPAAFDDALHKGLGRAVIWAQRGHADPQQLVDACLNDYRYDAQCEHERGDWLWEIVAASQMAGAIREPLLAALEAIETAAAPSQVCRLAAYVAAAGDHRFREHLERIVLDRPVADMPWLGDEELIELDEEEGFLMAIRRRVAELKTRDWNWHDEALLDDASKILGGDTVAQLLESEAALSDGAQLFVATLEEQEARQAAARSRKNTLSQFDADDVIRAAESSGDDGFRFRTWGVYANAGELQRVFDRLLACESTQSIKKYLYVFGRRAWPRFDPRMLDLCTHADAGIQRLAVYSAALNRHPEVRKLALSWLNAPAGQAFAVAMLSENYEKGDEVAILASLALGDDAEQRHSVLQNLLQLLEGNADCTCGAGARLIYEQSPCSMCRHGAVELLLERDTLPDNLRAESRFDAYPETRSLVLEPDEEEEY